MALGGIAAMVAFNISRFKSDHVAANAVGVAGTVMFFYGAHKQQQALNALNNAIWLYNRDLDGKPDQR